MFDKKCQQSADNEAPLTARMRPRTLDEFIGKNHIIGPGRLLRRAIQANQLSSDEERSLTQMHITPALIDRWRTPSHSSVGNDKTREDITPSEKTIQKMPLQNYIPRIFICYAHKDNKSSEPSQRWLDRLLEQIEPLNLQEQAEIWSDKRLEIGDEYS